MNQKRDQDELDAAKTTERPTARILRLVHREEPKEKPAVAASPLGRGLARQGYRHGRTDNEDDPGPSAA